MNAIVSHKSATLARAAMLVALTVESYGARREDKKISEDVARQHNAQGDVGKYNKQLVDKKFLEPITKAVTALRQYHYTHTLPWLDNGLRIIPVGMYDTYKREIAQLVDAYETATRDFCARWDSEIIPDARKRLNGMFNLSDYPADVRARFQVRSRFLPIPDVADFRVSIADSERQALAQQIEATMSDASQAAMRDLYERVSESVSHMADKLAGYRVVIGEDGKSKTENAFRDSLVENLRDICDVLPKLNFAGDSRLEAIRAKISATLLQHSAQELRDDFKVRESVQRGAAEIASEIGAAMSEFMAG